MAAMMHELKVMHPERDCRCYLLIDRPSRQAALIDPRFDDVRDYLGELQRYGLDLKFAVDTHTHADHLSGADRLRNLTGCKVVMGRATKSRVADTRADDGQVLPLGRTELRVLHTPGHTPDSICVVAGNQVFTGDTLFIGGAARTDFMGGDSGQLYDSFRKIEALGPDTQVWPGHDYNKKASSSVARELQTNPLFMLKDRDEVRRRLDIKGQLPANMAEILSFNTEAGLREAQIVRGEDLWRLGTAGQDYTLLDVRYADEWAAARSAHAVHVPMPQVRERWAEIEKLPRPIVSVCRSGVRATMVMMTARHAGDSDWLLLEGGMLAWQKAGLPMVCDCGAPEVIASGQAKGGSCAVGGGTCAAG
ncbi:MAG: MBL fold metallo-hydrolase [Planctomycetes bacterium]|nr:MBL fold metallo-hydrolase [Planctomycetota bacterium]